MPGHSAHTSADTRATVIAGQKCTQVDIAVCVGMGCCGRRSQQQWKEHDNEQRTSIIRWPTVGDLPLSVSRAVQRTFLCGLSFRNTKSSFCFLKLFPSPFYWKASGHGKLSAPPHGLQPQLLILLRAECVRHW